MEESSQPQGGPVSIIIGGVEGSAKTTVLLLQEISLLWANLKLYILSPTNIHYSNLKK